MKNFVQPGNVIEVVTAGAVASGAAVVVGSLVGVAQTAAEGASETITVSISGVFELPKTTGLSITQGGKVYLVTGTGAVTNTDNAGANPFVGYGWLAADNAATTAQVLLARPGE